MLYNTQPFLWLSCESRLRKGMTTKYAPMKKFSIGLCGLTLLVAGITVANFVRENKVIIKDTCVINLRFIQAAKGAWAKDMKIAGTPTPTRADLFGPTKYIHNARCECPGGGTYTIGALGEKPTCSVAGHVLH